MLYELTVRSTYFGQQVINRWNYLSTGIPASVLGSFALVAAFGAIPEGTPPVYDAALPFRIIYSGVSYAHAVNTIEARAASTYDPTDFYERPFVGGYFGTEGGEPQTPTISYGFRTNRVRLDVSRGTKRIAGVSETHVSNGGLLVGTGIAFSNSIATAMSDVLSYNDEGNTVTFTPCVVSKTDYNTPSGRTAYRYYPTLEQQLEHVASGILWEPYNSVRTQVSRQYGRGF
jgi:hypothetical protein